MHPQRRRGCGDATGIDDFHADAIPLATCGKKMREGAKRWLARGRVLTRISIPSDTLGPCKVLAGFMYYCWQGSARSLSANGVCLHRETCGASEPKDGATICTIRLSDRMHSTRRVLRCRHASRTRADGFRSHASAGIRFPWPWACPSSGSSRFLFFDRALMGLVHGR